MRLTLCTQLVTTTVLSSWKYITSKSYVIQNIIVVLFVDLSVQESLGMITPVAMHKLLWHFNVVSKCQKMVKTVFKPNINNATMTSTPAVYLLV